MHLSQLQLRAAPFDAVAARYDQTFTYSRIGKAQRAAVWSEVGSTFRAGQRVLEVGCGTGVDACFLAGRGVQVLACDPSAEMIRIADERVVELRFTNLVQTQILAAGKLGSLRPAQLFDGAFSNFGALNCVSDLDKLANELARLLKPGSMAILCWMGPYCLWEQLWYLAHGELKKAFRRFKRAGVEARLGNGASVHVHYPSISDVVRAFFSQFRLKSVRGIGVAVPPSYVEAWAARHPEVIRLCERADSRFAGWPLVRSLGDHLLIRLERMDGN